MAGTAGDAGRQPVGDLVGAVHPPCEAGLVASQGLENGVLPDAGDHVGPGPVEVGDSDRDPVGFHLAPQGLCEGRLHAGFGGAVGAHHRGGAEGGGGSDLEEVAAGVGEVGQEGSGGVGGSGEVDVDDSLPQVGRSAHEGAADRDAGVGHDHARPAELAGDLPGRTVEGGGVGDVRLDADVPVGQGSGRPAQGFLLAPYQRHEHPGVGEVSRECLADPARGARDDRDPPAQRCGTDTVGPAGAGDVAHGLSFPPPPPTRRR